VVDEGDAESSDPDEEMIIQTRNRGKSRLAFLKTGKPDRSRKVYQPGETSCQDPKSSHEILERNDTDEIKKYKARLVARGNMQEQGIYQDVFAPIARYETIRALLAVTVSDEMYVYQMEVISPYVQGEIHDEIYVE